MKFLIVISVLLLIIALAKIFKAKELIDKMKDVNSDPVSPAEIKSNATGMLFFGIVFFALVLITMFSWNQYLLPASASYHGEAIDTLMNVTLVIILIVFFITHALLFWFIFKYYFRKGKKAFWYPHNNRLEMMWTIIPAFVLILLISYGMSTWSDVMNAEQEEDAVVLEFVSEQFAWTARYAGEDQKLGFASFGLYGKNKVGVGTKAAILDRLTEVEDRILRINEQGDSAGLFIDSVRFEYLVAKGWNRSIQLAKTNTSLKNFRANKRRLEKMLVEYQVNPAIFDAGLDDRVINGDTIVLPKDRQVILKLRSKDVIHSAYLPHFRAQMNAVPGLTTQFIFKPRFTNDEMYNQALSEGKNFTGYVLICNKICGASHYNMKLHIKIVENKEYEEWLTNQKTFKEAFN